MFSLHKESLAQYLACSSSCSQLTEPKESELLLGDQERLLCYEFHATEHRVPSLLCERVRWWWGTAPSEIRGESTKQYSRQTPVFVGGGDAREYPGGLLRLDPALRMPSLLPHDLCPEWNDSPAPGTGSVHAQSRYQCLLSHVITDGTVT